MSRVQSKNLFDFKPAGEIEPAVKAMEAEFGKMYSSPDGKRMQERIKELELKHDDESNKEYVSIIRAAMGSFVSSMEGMEAYKYGPEQTITSSLNVPTTHYGEFDVPVEVYTPKDLVNDAKRAAYIYAHGGGAIALANKDLRSQGQCLAVDLSFVVFNVDYRLAPETKCPNNIKDFYEVIKYVSKNAESLGIDPAKIVIAGESGGGYICLGAMVLLAERDEGTIVKLAIPGIPMVDDYCFSDPLAMTVEERNAHLGMRKVWKTLIADDFEQQKTNPHLFPGKAKEELLEKFPPTIIMEAEFDMFITEATRLAGRLRRAGRLLEFVVIPGATHVSAHIPGTEGTKLYNDTMGTIAKEYVHS